MLSESYKKYKQIQEDIEWLGQKYINQSSDFGCQNLVKIEEIKKLREISYDFQYNLIKEEKGWYFLEYDIFYDQNIGTLTRQIDLDTNNKTIAKQRAKIKYQELDRELLTYKNPRLVFKQVL